MSKRKFISEFFKKGNRVGAVAPSSRFLVSKMLRPIDFSKAKVIVELGPGTGPMTLGMLKLMRPDAKIYAFETSETFCEQLRPLVDERVEVLNISAAQAHDYLAQKGIKEADYVVSSLPFAIIPKEVTDQIIASALEVLKPDGLYVQFQYSLASYKMFKRVFGKVGLNFTPFNIPPAVVYICSKPKKELLEELRKS